MDSKLVSDDNIEKKDDDPVVDNFSEEVVTNSFISFFINIEGIKNISNIQCALYDYLPGEICAGIAWVPPSWFILPIRFIGKVELPFLEVVRDVVRGVISKTQETCVFEPSGIITFHGPTGEPMVVSIKIKETQFFTDIQNKIEEKLKNCGFIGKVKESVPHITIGRVIKDNLTPFMGKIESFNFPQSNSITVNHVIIGYSEGSFKDPPVIFHSEKIGLNLSEEFNNKKVDLPELLPFERNSDELMKTILETSGLDIEKLELQINMEVKESPLMNSSPAHKFRDSEPVEVLNINNETKEFKQGNVEKTERKTKKRYAPSGGAKKSSFERKKSSSTQQNKVKPPENKIKPPDEKK
jgi:2'-5' RNA ligase